MPKRKRNLEDTETFLLRRKSSANGDTWDDEIELYVKKLQSKALTYKILHARTAAALARKGKVLSIINIIATASAGTSLLANIEAQEYIVTIVTAIILYVDSILIGISELMDYSGKAEEHRNSETGFDELVNIIERQLIIERSKRQKATDFMLWIDREFKMKHEKSPLIPNGTIKKMEKEYGSRLNPEMIDINHLNGKTQSEQHDVENPPNTDADESMGEEEEEDKEERKSHRSPRVKKKKKSTVPKKESISIFEDDTVLPVWPDVRMGWELDRYQQ